MRSNSQPVAEVRNGVRIVWDAGEDVVYARQCDAVVARRELHEHDPEVGLEYDQGGAVIGVIVIGIAVLGPNWHQHPARAGLPAAMATALDGYAALRGPVGDLPETLRWERRGATLVRAESTVYDAWWFEPEPAAGLDVSYLRPSCSPFRYRARVTVGATVWSGHGSTAEAAMRAADLMAERNALRHAPWLTGRIGGTDIDRPAAPLASGDG